jgi:hypothetical protein
VAEVTPALQIVPFCPVGGTGPLAFPARDAGIGPPDLERASHCRNRDECPKRAYKPAVWAIKKSDTAMITRDRRNPAERRDRKNLQENALAMTF